ncbi:MAG TPA: TSUP family transporter [Clostridiales bacterium]|nr:TSUP family transporter [Clostridiales bacterium]
MNWLITLLAGILSGAAGAMGLGGGGVLLLYLTLFAGVEQLKAQGINLIFFIPCGIIAIIIYSVKKQLEIKKILTSSTFGILGAFVGSWLADIIGGDMLSKIFAAGITFLGIREVFCGIKAIKNKRKGRGCITK